MKESKIEMCLGNIKRLVEHSYINKIANSGRFYVDIQN